MSAPESTSEMISGSVSELTSAATSGSTSGSSIENTSGSTSESSSEFSSCVADTFNEDFNSKNHVCGICTATKLLCHETMQPVVDMDEQPALLPCGHFFGYVCLSQWLKEKPQCPVCRFNLKYELCDHYVTPRLIPSMEFVKGTPKTIHEGGVIPDQCGLCREATEDRVAMDLLRAWDPTGNMPDPEVLTAHFRRLVRGNGPSW